MLIYKGKPIAEPGNVDFGNADISGIGDGTVTGAVFELNGKRIKRTEIAFGLSQALSAGAYGFGSSNINVSGDIELLYARIQTDDIAGMNGLQATPVYLKNQTLYYSYYAPQPVTPESLNKARWIVYYI